MFSQSVMRILVDFERKFLCIMMSVRRAARSPATHTFDRVPLQKMISRFLFGNQI